MKESSLTVSVIIPAYNAEAYVLETVTSALRQTYPLQEIICVDDGSTDGTLEVLRGLESQHPEQVHVLTGPNRGASAARNRGMERATGEYLQFLDADDVLLPEKIERDIAVLGDNHEILLFGSFEAFKGETKTDEVDTFVSDDPWVCPAKGNFGFRSSDLFRADAVEQGKLRVGRGAALQPRVQSDRPYAHGRGRCCVCPLQGHACPVQGRVD